eukprot:4829727-Lingulodinium_polyedra.AAC.1
MPQQVGTCLVQTNSPAGCEVDDAHMPRVQTSLARRVGSKTAPSPCREPNLVSLCGGGNPGML